MTPSLVGVTPSTERLSKMTVTEDRVKLVSSDFARAHTSAINTAHAAAEANHVTSVRHPYVTVSHKDVSGISVLPFPASRNKADGVQQLTRSVKSAMSDIPMRSDELCTEGLQSPKWVLRPLLQQGAHACDHP